MSDAVMGLNHFSEIEVKESVLSEKATSSPHYIQLGLVAAENSQTEWKIQTTFTVTEGMNINN